MSSRTPVDRSPALLELTDMARLRTNRTRSNRRPSASTEFCIQHIRRNIGRIRGHRFGCLTPTDRTGERRDRFEREHKRLQLFGAEGYPASVVARTSSGIAALASS